MTNKKDITDEIERRLGDRRDSEGRGERRNPSKKNFKLDQSRRKDSRRSEKNRRD